MFDYRFTRDAGEYTARLRKEAMNARLARSATSGLADRAARLFRSWASRLEERAAGHPSANSGGWSTDQERYESRLRNRPAPYASNGL